jgi:hypothetical protein
MNNCQDFYLTLFSDVQNPVHENKPHGFGHLLRERLDFTTMWEVALVEFTYANEIYNFNSHKCKVFLYKSKTHLMKRVELNGHFNNIKDVLKTLNENLKNEFEFHLTDDKINVKRFDPSLHLEFTPSLSRQLGFYTQIKVDEDLCQAIMKPNIELGLPSFAHIYCNLIDHQMHGDRYAQILRSVPLQHSQTTFGGRNFHNFNWLMYLPIIPRDVQDIKIDIKNDEHEDFPFVGGVSSVILHFRKRKNAYGTFSFL